MRFINMALPLSVFCCCLWSTAAIAFDPNGWCLPADACMGSMKPIQDLGYEECESRCALATPVEVNGMSATLFDRTCKGDWGARTERVLFIQIGAFNNPQVLMITNDGVEELKRCL